MNNFFEVALTLGGVVPLYPLLAQPWSHLLVTPYVFKTVEVFCNMVCPFVGIDNNKGDFLDKKAIISPKLWLG